MIALPRISQPLLDFLTAELVHQMARDQHDEHRMNELALVDIGCHGAKRIRFPLVLRFKKLIRLAA